MSICNENQYNNTISEVSLSARFKRPDIFVLYNDIAPDYTFLIIYFFVMEKKLFLINHLLLCLMECMISSRSNK